MKTNLPDSIKTIEEAKQFLKSLFDNGEAFHPEDDAHDIIWNTHMPEDQKPTAEECDLLNGLTDQMYSIKGNDIHTQFDPCGYYLELMEKHILFFTEFIGLKTVIEVRNSASELLLSIDTSKAGHDMQAMSTAGLSPENDADVFAYANHLLADKYTDYDFERNKKPI